MGTERMTVKRIKLCMVSLMLYTTSLIGVDAMAASKGTLRDMNMSGLKGAMRDPFVPLVGTGRPNYSKCESFMKAAEANIYSARIVLESIKDSDPLTIRSEKMADVANRHRQAVNFLRQYLKCLEENWTQRVWDNTQNA